MLEQALKAMNAMPESSWRELLNRLDTVRRKNRDFGYGVGDHIEIFVRSEIDGGAR